MINFRTKSFLKNEYFFFCFYVRNFLSIDRSTCQSPSKDLLQPFDGVGENLILDLTEANGVEISETNRLPFASTGTPSHHLLLPLNNYPNYPDMLKNSKKYGYAK